MLDDLEIHLQRKDDTWAVFVYQAKTPSQWDPTIKIHAAGPTAYEALHKLADAVVENREITSDSEAMEISTRHLGSSR